MRSRYMDGVYVLFQIFTQDPPQLPYRVLLWYCGRYTSANGSRVYDFE